MRLPRLCLLALLTALFVALVALGNWQIARRAWKLDLIDRVETRLMLDPVAAPGPSTWPQISRSDEYRRIQITGRFRHDLETCTQAVTVRGPGCWVVTPLLTGDGWWLLVNRGFVDTPRRNPATRMAAQIDGRVALSGLLRLSEPGGGFLRANKPAQNRWTSRDVTAIASFHGLSAAAVAPYFLDAETSVAGGPIGGLTVVKFRNSHLVYALTWYGLALMALAAVVTVFRSGTRRQPPES